jgi:general stress protein 26
MNDQPHTDKSPDELRDRVWELAESIGTCMLVSWDGEKQRARPMVPTLKRDEHAIYFLTDKDSGKVWQEKEFPRVTLTFADTPGNKFVAMTGAAAVGQDRAKIKELWNPAAKAWWDSPDDPAIRVLTITPDEAELWDSPNKLIATAVMLTAAATGKRPSLGDNARVNI